MEPLLVCVFLPYAKLSLHLYLFHTVHGGYVKFPDRLIVLRGIPCGNNYPPFGDFMVAKGLIL